VGERCGNSHKKRQLRPYGGECVKYSEEKANGNGNVEDEDRSRSNVLQLCLVTGYAKAFPASDVRSTEPVVLAALPITIDEDYVRYDGSSNLRVDGGCLSMSTGSSGPEDVGEPKGGREHLLGVGRGCDGGHWGAVPGAIGGGTHGRRERALTR
jgi:hypothetical protein